ncbi:MAG: tetratricopeptide repeat protein [Ignavibacteria bacterium]
MLAKKKKISKKEIQEDKLVTSYYKFLDFYNEYQTKILSGLAIVAVIVVGSVIYINNLEEQNQQANAEISRVIKFYEEKKFQEAIDGVPGTNMTGFLNVVDKYGGTEQGETAKIFLANSYYFLGKIDDAKKYYDDYSGSSNIYKASALAGLAGCYEAEDNFEKAASLFGDAAKVDKNNVSNPNYLLNAGINYSKAGKKDKAKELFEVIKSEYKTSTEANQVNRYLEKLKLG